jgi:hypothetical protein
VLPHNAPEYFWQTVSGELEFAVPGWDVRTVDYAVALSLGKAPLSENQRPPHQRGLGEPEQSLHRQQVPGERGDERVKDWASYVANAKFKPKRSGRAH